MALLHGYFNMFMLKIHGLQGQHSGVVLGYKRFGATCCFLIQKTAMLIQHCASQENPK
jgi:hypothetical protein